MEKLRRRKHRAHKRVLVVGNQHRPFLESTLSGSAAMAEFEQVVGDEAAQIAEQDSCGSEQEAASSRCQQGRKALSEGVKLLSAVSARVTLDDGESAVVDGSPVRTDEDLIARVENVVKTVTPHVELFVKKGLPPGFLDQLSNELAAFKKAKDTLTAVGKRYTEANDRIDGALAEGDKLVRVFERVLTTSPNAPVGALTALQQAKLIGPRADDASQPGATNPPPATEPPAAPDAPAAQAATTSHEEHPASEPAAPAKVA